ncbi:hypothetical protein D3C87_1610900 [compost metagenome]
MAGVAPADLHQAHGVAGALARVEVALQLDQAGDEQRVVAVLGGLDVDDRSQALGLGAAVVRGNEAHDGIVRGERGGLARSGGGQSETGEQHAQDGEFTQEHLLVRAPSYHAGMGYLLPLCYALVSDSRAAGASSRVAW